MLKVRITDDHHLARLFGAHPEASIGGSTEDALIEWQGSTGTRSIVHGQPDLELAGLVEIMDNNPLVCASQASVPDTASTMALIALGPAIRGSILRDTPVMACSFEADEHLTGEFLAKEGWTEGISIHSEPVESGTVLAAKAMVEIDPATEFQDLIDLYDESYGRCFFVRGDQESVWHPRLVEGSPNAVYRLELAKDDRAALLKIQVLADRHGKCGAAQVVHMFNVMCGFEESLGLD